MTLKEELLFGDFTKQELESLYIKKLKRSKKRLGSESTPFVNQISSHRTKSDTLFDNFDLVKNFYLNLNFKKSYFLPSLIEKA